MVFSRSAVTLKLGIVTFKLGFVTLKLGFVTLKIGYFEKTRRTDSLQSAIFSA